MTQTVCDRCGEVIKVPEQVPSLAFNSRTAAFKLDLCPECVNAFQRFRKGK